MTDWEHLALSDQNGFDIALENIYRAGLPIVRGIVDEWDCEMKAGVKTDNYVGDIFGSLGGEPDFGLGSITNGKPVPAGGGDGTLEKREMSRRVTKGRRGLGKF